MKLIFNGDLIEEDQPGLNELYRAVFFGDGLFESIYADNEHVFLLEDHLQRMKKGAEYLYLPFPKELEPDHALKDIGKIIHSNERSPAYRIKILLWRAGKGTYMPDPGYKSNYIIICEASSPFAIRKISNVSVSEEIRLAAHRYSGFKRISALEYVIAAIERGEKNDDELILGDFSGNIAEGISSNVILIDLSGRKIISPKSSSRIESTMSPYVHSYLEQKFKGFSTEDNKEIALDDLGSISLMYFYNSFNISVLENELNAGFRHDADEILSFLPKLPLPL